MEIANDVNNLIQSDNTGATDNSAPLTGDDAAMDFLLKNMDSNGTTNESDETEQVETTAEVDDVETTEQPDTDSEVDTEETEANNEEQTTEYETLTDDSVKIVNGRKMTGKEIANGIMLHADYTRKTQEASAVRKEADKAIVEAKRIIETEVLSDLRRQFEVEYNFNRPTPAEWKEWEEYDPDRYVTETKKWNARDQQVRQLMEYDKQTKAIQEAEAKEAHEKAVEEAHTVFTGKYPEFLDAKTRAPLVKDMVSTLEGMGFNHDEISNISDARHMEIVYLASQALKANKANNVAKQLLATKPITKPATPKTSKSQPIQFSNEGWKPGNEEALIEQLAASMQLQSISRNI